MNHLNDLDVLLLGLGDSGLAMARWCARHGARLRVWDSRVAPPQAAALALAVPEAVLFSGPLDADALQASRLILKSPGLAPQDARIAPLLAAARAQGLAVQGELDLYVRALADLQASRGYAPKVLAITGTNGKTTTAALTALLVERSGLAVALAGNIGPTLLDTLAGALEAQDDDGAPAALPAVWVLELSSFQLEGGGDGVRGFEPSAAALLNITQDHLDWHGSMQAYAAAKGRIFGEHAVRVINRDDAQVQALVAAPAVAAGTPKPTLKSKARPAPPRSTVRFGLGAPQEAGDFGLVVENGMAWLVRAQADEAAPRKRGAGGAGATEATPFQLQRLMPADALRIRGRHNAANAQAALALAGAIGCPLAPMLHALREYRGEPHRVAFVARVGEVDAYDDSKGTNVGATVAALLGLGADQAPGKLVVILGGDGKGQDFAALADPVAQHARAVALIGKDAAAIESALAGGSVPLQRHATLEAATAWCYEQAQAGDAVLLSPACASLDMFRNYGHRADVFVAAVQAHAAEQGVPA